MFINRDDVDQPLAEKRKLPRYQVKERISLAIEDEERDEAIGLGEVADINLGGLRARRLPARYSLRPGARLRMILIDKESVLPLRARVVHQRPDGTMGLEFVCPSQEERRRIYRLYIDTGEREDLLFPEFIDAG